MDSKRQSEIAKKYWEGSSSLEEEKSLFRSNLDGVSEEDNIHFQKIKAFKKIALEDSFKADLLNKLEVTTQSKVRILMPTIFWKIAAVFLIGFSTYYYFSTPPLVEKEPIADLEEDPEKAYEITKQALLLVSEKLNKAAELNLPLDKFETAQTRIKAEKK